MDRLDELQSDSLDVAIKLGILNDLKATQHAGIPDSGDNNSSASLEKVVTSVLAVLQTSKPVFRSNDAVQKLRMVALEVLQRLPFDQAFKQQLKIVMGQLVQLIKEDNEEIACLCLKFFIDLHKTFKNSIEEFVQPFLDTVLQIYKNMPGTVKEVFDVDLKDSSLRTAAGVEMSSNEEKTIEGGEAIDRPLQQGMKSFKVLTECPIIIVLLFSTYRQIVQPNLLAFTPAIVEMLGLKAGSQASSEQPNSPTSSRAHRKMLLMSPMFGDFILAQIKTLSFLAYVLRGFTTFMRRYASVIPVFVIRLLRDCPPQMSPARKELLVATRHILSTDFRTAFVPVISALLDESTLIGTGVTSRETLRPLAYSMLADLIHHIRNDLTTPQIRHAITIYNRNLLDPSLAISIQTMSAKLLLNMIDRIMKIQAQSEARHLLMLILEGFAAKLESLNMNEHSQEGRHWQEIRHNLRELGIAIGSSVAAGTSDNDVDVSKDSRVLFKNLIFGLKTILFGLKNCNPNIPANLVPALSQQWNDSVRGLEAADIVTFRSLFAECCRGLIAYRSESATIETFAAASGVFGTTGELTASTISAPVSREEKDIIETFATVFIHLDPASFQEIFEYALPDFFLATLQNATLLHIPQYFLTNDAVSANFMGLLLHFLLERLEELGSADSMRSSVLLRLFKMCFMAVTMYPDQNEVILQPHLARIIVQALKLSSTAAAPINYYILLRALFRSIGGGRFELLYKEVLPLLQVLLESLNTLLQSARKQQEKELYVELCLTVPVRLSVLLPYLSYLMRPLVIALRAGPDLVTQGMRTLELCIDNLTQEFMDPILAPVLNDLIHHHSHPAVRILGKMGGRNRRFLEEAQKFEYNEDEADLPSVAIEVLGSETLLSLRWTRFQPLCIKTLGDHRSDDAYKLRAFNVLATTVKLFLAHGCSESCDSSILRKMALQVIEPAAIRNPSAVVRATQDEPVARGVVQKVRAQEEVFREALGGVFLALSCNVLVDEARSIIRGATSHFAILHLYQSHVQMARKRMDFSIDMVDDSLFLDANVYNAVLVDAMSSEVSDVRDGARAAMQDMLASAIAIVGDANRAAELPVFASLTARFCHQCFEEQWHRKAGGVAGLAYLAKNLDLGTTWARAHHLEVIKALLFVVKDIPAEVATLCVDEAIGLVLYVVKVCYKESKPDDHTGTPLVGLLITELSNPNGRVRSTAQTLLQSLSECTSASIESILKPVQERLLTPIFTKPLRALPFAMQIGHIDAITFCLGLERDFLPFNDELMRLLHEALALADAEDDALVSVNRTSQYKNTSALVNLRVVCIRLLTIAVTSPAFNQQQQAQSRGRIIATFFKSLYAKSPEVVETANKGLQKVLAQNNKLPKDLLQAGLRPILMNLSDHKRLSVPGLEGLARLLELLTNYFKVEIGRKLLDHLKAWADPGTLQQLAAKPLDDQQAVKVIAAIINIFHLLPSTAHMFMDDLVTATLELETHLRRTSRSPFRKALLVFLRRYPQETCAYFKAKISNVKLSNFLVGLFDEAEDDGLRATLDGELEALMKIITTSAAGKSLAARRELQLISRLSVVLARHGCEHATASTHWQDLIKIYVDLSRVEATEDIESHRSLHASRRNLVDYSLALLKRFPNDVQRAFAILTAPVQLGLLTTDSIENHFIGFICRKGDQDDQAALLSLCIDAFPDKELAEEIRIKLFQLVINPLLLLHRHDSDSFIDTAVVERIHAKVWRVALADFSEDAICSSDLVKLEILQMSTLFIRFYPDLLADIRKDIIKFAWNYIKLDDVTTKNAAYVFISFFIAAFDTPAKIAAQIFVALLRAGQPEARLLVRQALDTLAPVLSSRIPATDPSGAAGWIKYPRKVLAEENNLQQLFPVLHFLVRQAEIFRPERAALVPQIIGLLPKLGLSANASAEARALSLDLATIVLDWNVESKDAQREANDGDAMETDVTATNDEVAPSDEQAGSIVNMLIRQALTSTDPSKTTTRARIIELASRYFSSQKAALNVVDRSLFEAPLNDIEEKEPATAVVAVQVLDVFIRVLPVSELLANAQQYIVLLENCLRSPTLVRHEATARVFMRLLACAPPTDDESAMEDGFNMSSKLVQLLQEHLQTGVSLLALMPIVKHLAAHREDLLDMITGSLMKTFNTLVREHISIRPVPPSLTTAPTALAGSSAAAPGTIVATPGPTQPAALNSTMDSGNATSIDQETTCQLILDLIDVLKTRISQLGDQRRFYLAALSQLIDKSPSYEICSQILELITDVVVRKKDVLPTIKEKVTLLLKMLSFEHRSDSRLINQFLELIITIYQDPSIARTELTVRLEQAFLMGTRAHDFKVRSTFMNIFNSSMSRSVHTRFNYIFNVQSWETLANYFWISQASHLLAGSIATDRSITLELTSCRFRTDVASRLSGASAAMSDNPDDEDEEMMEDDKLENFLNEHAQHLERITRTRAGDLVDSICDLQYLDPHAGHMLWCTIMPIAWSAMGRKDRQESSRAITIQLSKEYNLRQVERRPNVIQTILTAVSSCVPTVSLPPHLLKYLGKTFNAWFPAMELLERSAVSADLNEVSHDLKDSTIDALTELYASLCEEDMFYGLWRRRCRYLETNAAISYEQNGMWDKSQQMYEAAQIKARTGVLPFSESEYALWEDHWVLCAQKLQQWDVLTDLAKQEGYSDLLLECAWRVSDWTSDREPLEASIKTLMDVPTPRRYIFDAFMTLQKTQAKLESIQEFHRICDDGMQLALRKWHQLPPMVSQTHLPLLQAFQQFVELHEASQIYHSLANTTAQNLEAKSHELKHILQTWRERLPNFCDDINSWSDLVAWRQLIFASINRVYLPLVPTLQASNAAAASTNATSFAYRGYHETAWIINRFAHVARKHQLPEVCINQLTKIYTLPNIEIQEAFLKLREQAKCHFQNPNELGMGLEVISNTNLMYFGTQQKAEFFTLKGMFLAKMKLNDEANQAFATAIQIDLMLPKAWAEWGQYSDRLFQEDPTELTKAGNAVSCYLQAAGLYKNGRARKMLSRVLWLLSLDDSHGTISGAFDSYKGEVPTWYWITFIPQLLTSLSHKEARHARQILIRIAKTFPQALHFQLRTTKEDYAVIKKQAAAAAASAAASKSDASKSDPAPNASAHSTIATTTSGATPGASNNGLASATGVAGSGVTSSQTKSQDVPLSANAASIITKKENGANAASLASHSPRPTAALQNRQPWEHEIMAILKTAYPLLALSMETLVDQIQQRFKCQADEDAYRLIVALLNDGVQYIGRLGSVTEDTKLPPATQANITRFADSVLPKNIKAAFEKEFVQEKPNLQDYVSKLRKWRDKFEMILDRRSTKQQLEQFSSYLSEFQYQKFDEVEIPGQYLQHRDNNNDFVRIDRFMPTLDVVRGHGICYRRITIRGHDGSLHPFAIQYPAARHCRREERIIQLFRILSGVLSRRKESRKRGLTFNLPAAVPLAPHIRIVQDDPAYISLQSIYEDYCAHAKQHKDEPLRLAADRISKLGELANNKQELIKAKVDVLEEIRRELIPDTLVLDFFKQSFAAYSDFWRFRKHFSLQYASLTFMTYVMNINNRFPHKLFISRRNGLVWGTEILPGMAQNNPVFHNGEAVPFRFTPTISTLMGSIGVEGVYSCAIMAIARCLTEPAFELDQHLSIFVRDELITWFTQQHRPVTQETQLREKVAANVDLIVRRASSLSQVAQGNLPAHQTIIDLISQSVSPRNLAQMDQLWSPWL
ncbi:transcription-associated protein 1 [Savitreella phatthalungensis]